MKKTHGKLSSASDKGGKDPKCRKKFEMVQRHVAPGWTVPEVEQ